MWITIFLMVVAAKAYAGCTLGSVSVNNQTIYNFSMPLLTPSFTLPAAKTFTLKMNGNFGCQYYLSKVRLVFEEDTIYSNDKPETYFFMEFPLKPARYKACCYHSKTGSTYHIVEFKLFVEYPPANMPPLEELSEQTSILKTPEVPVTVVSILNASQNLVLMRFKEKVNKLEIYDLTGKNVCALVPEDPYIFIPTELLHTGFYIFHIYTPYKEMMVKRFVPPL